MRIAITSKGDSLESGLDPRFGRCQYFIIVDSDDLQNFKALSNDAVSSGGGAGIKAAQTVINEGVEAVISGNFGPNAFDALYSGGVKLYTADVATVKDAVDALGSGKARLLESASAAAHAGLREI
ncbi:MAG: NifB/NifX family molybdenum-iron cluster-binding protein [Deltaproteobacteria bacterium]|uniref:NifB/NifX family molybdenum-iron cluster-binding protein n=1 Tax=Candidatus Zymogenus saltonus TaxID=2844893 RepID=A0A9D8PPE7_9DELT|nr:NifB/NifX family molybdenum-iron cluster-binding protein [Candidatus Zymogenus saltonus]